MSPFSKIFLLLFVYGFLVVSGHAQNIEIQGGIRLPQDSVERRALISSLNGFLEQVDGQNTENEWVLPTQKGETYLLLDELKGIKASKRFKTKEFYKPYLTNLVSLNGNQYHIQISFIGVNNNIPYLRASIELIAHKTDDILFFSSPLLVNTASWKSQKIGNNIFYYKQELNTQQAMKFGELAAEFDKKLGSENKITELYCCENILELERIIGVTYKIDYNGRKQATWSARDDDRKIVVLGNGNSHFDHFDEHDLWHDRLSLVTPRNKVNKPVDEGCAYLYGGSWGYSWEEIFSAFNEQVVQNKKKVDWLKTKDQPIHFKTGKYSNSADYIVNALLVKEIEKEWGFEGVKRLLDVGPYEKGNEKYFQTLTQLTGITKSNYNRKVKKLIAKEQQQ